MIDISNTPIGRLEDGINMAAGMLPKLSSPTPFTPEGVTTVVEAIIPG